MSAFLTLASIALLGGSVKPNVVFILADDVGYGDLGCYGATLTKTPNLDRMAREGIRFTDAHSSATVCTPTRYSLLTGQYSFRHAPGAGILSGVAPLSIPKDRLTLPQVLKRAGYRTGVVGKWHLGLGDPAPDFNQVLEPGAKQVGFDYSFIVPATGDRVPCVYVENGRVVGWDSKDPIQVSFGAKVGNEPTGQENPELLKLKPVVGHLGTIVNGVSRIGFMTGGNKARWVDEDMADTITKRAVRFIEQSKDKPFFLYLPTHDVHAPLLPHARFNGLTRSGLRGDTLAQMDWTVGEVLKTLERLKIRDNTIIVFSSDNGGVDRDGYADPREDLNGHQVNGALRGTKYTLYEGGHRVPMVVSWPASAPKGKVSDALVGQIDFMASLAKLAGVALGEQDAPDSFELSEALFEGKAMGRRNLLHHLGGLNKTVAYREGDKVIVPKGDTNWELFDLSKDLSQKRDLALERPETLKHMIAAVERHKASVKTRQ